MHSSNHLQRIYGVDFSGAANAGKKIWIACGVIEKGKLKISDCYQANALPDSGNERGACMAALRDFIRKERASAFGFDFPFGLPRDLVKENRWEDFVLSFPTCYASAEEFRRISYKAGGNRELRRITDRKRRTPFSPYNLRLYRQAYFGICEILAPLVREHLVSVLPMQKVQPGKTWLLEVCPASTLKHEHLYSPYKGMTRSHYNARVRILEWIEESCTTAIPKALRTAVLEDHQGDALDSIIAALATFRAINTRFIFSPVDHIASLMEGYVYI